MTNAVDQLKMYVQASETTGNGKSRHCQDCRDAVAEMERLRAALQRIIDLNAATGRLEVPQTRVAREALNQQSTITEK